MFFYVNFHFIAQLCIFLFPCITIHVRRYGWTNFRNVASLISGLGIFFVGAGLSFYHGILGLTGSAPPEPLFWVR